MSKTVKNSKTSNNTNEANNEVVLFPTFSIDNIDNVIATIEQNMKSFIEYSKKIASDKDELAKQEQANKSNETLIATMLANKQITQEQANKLKETMIVPVKSSLWDKYPVSSSRYDSFYKDEEYSKYDTHENRICIENLTLYYLQTRACLYALKQYKELMQKMNEGTTRNEITNILNKENCELFNKKANSQCKRSGQNYKIGKTALELTSNIDDLLK